MDQPENIHIEFWTMGIFPIALYKAFLEKAPNPDGIRPLFVEEKKPPSVQRRRTSSLLSIDITFSYYTDFIAEEKGNALYDLVLKGLQPMYDILSNGDGKAKDELLKLRDNKYEFIYIGSNKIPLLFSFKSHWSEDEERAAYEKMINYIDSYETKDEQVHTEIQNTLSDKDQVRFFSYDPGNDAWIIQDVLSEITHAISLDYLKYKKDNRVAKPDILMNEDKFNEHFVFDQQWILTLNKFQVIMARPNDVALYLSLMDKNLTKAKPFLEDAIKRRNKNPYFNMMLCKLPLKLGHRHLEFSGFSNILSTKRLSSILEGFPFAVCG